MSVMKTVEQLIRRLVRETITSDMPKATCRVCGGTGDVAEEFCATCSGEGEEIDYTAGRGGIGRGPVPYRK